jgi:hypothetical protein
MNPRIIAYAVLAAFWIAVFAALAWEFWPRKRGRW